MDRHYIRNLRLNEILEDSYIKYLPVIQRLSEMDELSLDFDVVFFVGENGVGKSTLIEAIAINAGFNSEGGSKNFNFETKNTTSNLYKYITLTKDAYEKDGFFLRAESFYNVASETDELYRDEFRNNESTSFGNISLHNQSHGESFMSLVQNRFWGNGLYILDEPEAALSPSRQLSLLAEMNYLVRHKSQFIISTHSPILLSYPGAIIYEIIDSGINRVNYDECKHVLLTKQFLEHPTSYFRYLFEDEGDDKNK